VAAEAHWRRHVSKEPRLGCDHTVAGNPLRFKRGTLEIRADDEWRSGMRFRSRALATAVAAPLLATYGFPLVGGGLR
jgi:hypothetical protein